MLRMLFGEPPREWGKPHSETVQAIERYTRLMSEKGEGGSREAAIFRKMAIWSEGLLRSLDELEQSIYAARRFAQRLTKPSLEEMSPEERLDYYRHVYFDKNAFIRLFALLDKLGVLLNDRLGLHTDRIKSRFSFFTVLRSMRGHAAHALLADALSEGKTKHQEALTRLRRRRNMEIHYMNEELQDDLLHSLQPEGGAAHLENIQGNMNDLEEGWQMVGESLRLSFLYLLKLEHSHR